MLDVRLADFTCRTAGYICVCEVVDDSMVMRVYSVLTSIIAQPGRIILYNLGFTSANSYKTEDTAPTSFPSD